MTLILDGIRTALSLIFACDAEVLAVTLLSLSISVDRDPGQPPDRGSAGVALALSRFPGRRFLVSLVNTGMGLPPVVVGLFVTIFLWRNGPLGVLELLYTPTAMIIAQSLIATPIVTGISLAAIQQLPPKSAAADPGPRGDPLRRWSGCCCARRACRCWQQ